MFSEKGQRHSDVFLHGGGPVGGVGGSVTNGRSEGYEVGAGVFRLLG